ncbi:hypothetical protein RND81_05G035200 [Saponaria officinalis]|uniref:Uncharacterized protein n=1 Tax=Saponaria officinalis TaxID=3572 RepID=A0AAW1KUH5_SAPOF
MAVNPEYMAFQTGYHSISLPRLSSSSCPSFFLPKRNRSNPITQPSQRIKHHLNPQPQPFDSSPNRRPHTDPSPSSLSDATSVDYYAVFVSASSSASAVSPPPQYCVAPPFLRCGGGNSRCREISLQ